MKNKNNYKNIIINYKNIINKEGLKSISNNENLNDYCIKNIKTKIKTNKDETTSY
jgi:hypothetical protein